MADEVRNTTKCINITTLLVEVNADPTISGEGTCTRIFFEEPDKYTFQFNVTLSAAAQTALDAVLAAHDCNAGPGEPPIGGFGMKAGAILSGSFSGNPKTAVHTFNTPYDENQDYVITYSVETDNQKTHYIPTTSTQDASGFTVSIGTGSLSNLVAVNWHSLKIGEE